MLNGRFCLCFISLLCTLASSKAGSLVQIFTGLGEIDLELFDQEKPKTVQNFIRLAQAGYFEGSFFHRCVPGFVLQGGGFGSFNPASTGIFGPPWTYTFSVPNFGTITNEFSVGPFRSNIYGTVAMAKNSDPNSATSQFFINLADNSGPLDNPTNSGGFTVFGRVVRGTNILNQFNGISKGHNLVDLRDSFGTNDPTTSLFSTLPTYALGTNAPPYNQLIYFSASVLTVHAIARGDKTVEIAWNSVNAMTNFVEFTPSFPPSWQSLAATNGTGTTIKVTDSDTNVTQRFYRIRVAY